MPLAIDLPRSPIAHNALTSINEKRFLQISPVDHYNVAIYLPREPIMFKAQKRFIAGAVCPKCSEMDKLVMYRNESGKETRECVACGYIDVMKDEEQALDELATRVTPVGKAIRDDGEQAIKIFDVMPNSDTKH